MEESVFEARINTDKLSSNVQGLTLSTVEMLTDSLFQRLISVTTTGLNPRDFIRICLFSDSLDRPISTCLIEVSEMSVEKIMSAILKVLQSKDEIPLDESFEINVITVRKSLGAGRSAICNIDTDILKKRYVFQDIKKRNVLKSGNSKPNCYIYQCLFTIIFLLSSTDQSCKFRRMRTDYAALGQLS